MFEQKHSDLLEKFGNKFPPPTNGDEPARAWTRQCAEQFNYTFPSEGWGTKRASPTRPPSTDVICRLENNILTGYDTVIAAGSPDARLNLHPEPMNINDQVFIPVDRINHLQETPVHSTMLGASLFWAWAGYKKYQTQLIEELTVLKQDLNIDYIRWFFTVGENRQGDPWSDVGAFYDDDRHLPICRGVMTLLKSMGIKSHMTLVGAFSQANTIEKRNAIVDRAAILINEFPDDFVGVEIWNEYIVNFAERAWLRDMARRLKAQLPEEFPITLSSPNSVMNDHSSAGEISAETEAMYGGQSGANFLTIHSSRPNYYWNPETVRVIGITLPILNGEPRGPGASAGGDVTDPNTLGDDYLACIRGNGIGHTLHTEIGVWGHHLDPVFNYYHPDWFRFRDITNWNEICRILKEIRDSGNFEPVDPVDPTDLEIDSKLMPGERLNPGQRLYSPSGKYYMEYQGDGNLVIYEKDVQAIWASNSAGQSLGYCEMQGDGNFVLYNQNDPIGATGTSSYPGTMAQLQDDGNFVLYQEGVPIWASLSSEWFT